MSVQGKIKQYAIILETLKDGKQKTFAQLKRQMDDEGFMLSDRTIQRIIEQLRAEYGLDLSFNNKTKKYSIDPNALPGVSSFLRLYQAAGLSEFVETVFKHKKKLLNRIDVEKTGYLKGIQWLPPSFKAMLHNNIIRFSHESFHRGTIRKYTVQPYMLKEYQYRWYLVGIDTSSGRILNFGLDRIKELEILSEKFEPDKKFPYQTLFSNTIGLSFDVDEVSEVIFTSTPIQAKYLEALPLHHSQEVIANNETEVTFRLYVVVNIELIQHLLRLGDEVKIISPASLKDKLIDIYKAALARYTE
jgi:WYL domain